jgi:hypothetical protein
MKNLLFLLSLLTCFAANAQQHFAGINTSSRTGIINGQLNPAEFANISSDFEIFVLASSITETNNKIGFKVLVGGDDFEEQLFSGEDPVNLRVDGELVGPGLAYKWNKWVFAVTTKAYAKSDLVDVNPVIGDAVSTGLLSALINTTTFTTDYNQRANGTAWGEVGLSVARNLYDDGTHLINAGATLKILFPGSYANLGADEFSGTIVYGADTAELTDATANLNISYSGNLGESFTSFNDYAGSLFGKVNGLAGDVGVNYRWNDNMEEGRYKLNAGLSVTNIGQMTFSAANNSTTNYVLSIPAGQSLNLNQFQHVNSLAEVETILLDSGYLNRTENNDAKFKVSLPTTLTAYADVKIISNFYATIFTKQNLKDNNRNTQITNDNVTSLTPRYLLNNLEFLAPLSVSEISGFSAGVGFRAYGFFVGSSSILTALFNDSKQADAYIGYSFRLQ